MATPKWSHSEGTMRGAAAAAAVSDDATAAVATVAAVAAVPAAAAALPVAEPAAPLGFVHSDLRMMWLRQPCSVADAGLESCITDRRHAAGTARASAGRPTRHSSIGAAHLTANLKSCVPCMPFTQSCYALSIKEPRNSCNRTVNSPILRGSNPSVIPARGGPASRHPHL